jgi:cystathionine beta-synthase
MGQRLPVVGIGEPVGRLVAELEAANAVLVLDGGHPFTVISRADLLNFLGGVAHD